LLSVTAPLSAREVRVGVLTDGPSAREGLSAAALEHAAAAVYGDGLTLTVAPQRGHNFTYVTTFNRVDDQVATFHRIIGFSHLVVLADPLALQVVRELQIKGTALRVQV
jgi:hypothetical protein